MQNMPDMHVGFDAWSPHSRGADDALDVGEASAMVWQVVWWCGRGVLQTCCFVIDRKKKRVCFASNTIIDTFTIERVRSARERTQHAHGGHAGWRPGVVLPNQDALVCAARTG